MARCARWKKKILLFNTCSMWLALCSFLCSFFVASHSLFERSEAESETSLPAGQAGEGGWLRLARYLISKLSLMSDEPTWGGRAIGK